LILEIRSGELAALVAGNSCPKAPAEWQVLVSEDFESDLEAWPGRRMDVPDYTALWEVVDGKYSVQVTAQQRMLDTFTLNDLPLVGDFYMSVDVEQTTGPHDAEYGVLFHFSHQNGYYFAVSQKQNFAAWLNMHGWISVEDWTDTPAIRLEKVNQLSVLALGDQYTLCINDRMVFSFQDDRKTGGFPGLAVGLQRGGNGNFEFDNFVLRAPR
jgi:hypothetical protein